MVVINGNNMTDTEPDAEPLSANKMKTVTISQIENKISQNNSLRDGAGDQALDCLYDDIEPAEIASTNGKPQGVAAAAMSTTNAFDQLVSKTLTYDFYDEQQEDADNYQKAGGSRSEASLNNECVEREGTHNVNNGQMEANSKTNTAPVITGAPHAFTDSSEIDYEEESEMISDDEEEMRQEQMMVRNSDADPLNRSNEGQNSSVLIDDSEDDNEECEDVPEEECEEEERLDYDDEEMDDEELEEEEEEVVDEQEILDEEPMANVMISEVKSTAMADSFNKFRSKPGPLSCKAKVKSSNNVETYVNNSNSSSLYDEKADSLRHNKQNGGSPHNRNYENMGRDHASLMKKLEFEQQLNSVKNKSWNSDVQLDHAKPSSENYQECGDVKTDSVSTLSNERNEEPKSQNVKVLSNNLNKNCTNKITTDSDNKIPKQKEVSASKNTTEAASTLVAILNERMGYFEIGRCSDSDPELAFHNFSVSVLFLKGLTKVVPGAILRSCREGPYLSYSLLGCPVTTDPLPDIKQPVFPSERANARVLTTAANLKKYFTQHLTVVATLMIGEIVLAKATVDMKKFSETITADKDTGKLIIKLEGAYELVPVEGNVAASFSGHSSDEALVGLVIELERLPESMEAATKDNNDDGGEEKDSGDTTRAQKRPRRDSLEQDSPDHSSTSLLSARKKLKEHLSHPPKKRKMASADPDEDTNETKKEQIWKDAEEDLLQWRQAQENVFWKQWVLREKKLQDSLSDEWKRRVGGLEQELEERLEEVESEKAALEEQWRRLQEREERCSRMEERLMALQEDLLEQQTAISAHMRAPQHAPAMSSAVTKVRTFNSGDSNKQYYKSQWLRGIATTHRRWASGRAVSSSALPELPSSSSFAHPSSLLSCSRLSPFNARESTSDGRGSVSSALRRDGASTSSFLADKSSKSTASKYNTPIIEEISRLTKERKILLANHLPDSPVICNIDKTLNKLLDASGV